MFFSIPVTVTQYILDHFCGHFISGPVSLHWAQVLGRPTLYHLFGGVSPFSDGKFHEIPLVQSLYGHGESEKKYHDSLEVFKKHIAINVFIVRSNRKYSKEVETKCLEHIPLSGFQHQLCCDHCLLPSMIQLPGVFAPNKFDQLLLTSG